MLHDTDLVSVQEVRSSVDRAHAAAQKFASFSQEQVDAIVERMASEARANAERLAVMAVEETGYGNVGDKFAKNILCSEWLLKRIRGMKTVGVIRELPEERVVEYGVPVGVVAAVIPTTNPTSTVIFKSIVSLKAGNAIVISPHPRAVKSTSETAAIVYKAALAAGAPEDIIQCLQSVSLEGTQALMRHPKTGVILATGGHGMVRSAYSSGKPAFGVGPGNVPVLLDRTADVKEAIAKVVSGKSFDYGTVCSSEQVLVVEEVLRDQVMAELKAQKAYFCSESQKAALTKVLFTTGTSVNPECVGQSPVKIAKMAGFEVPPDTSIIVVEIGGVGKQHPLSAEKLSPVLALVFAKDFAQALDHCEGVLRFGGIGHTAVIYSKDDARIRQFGARMPAMRLLVNTASPQGSVGVTTNLLPSMTLGCGAMGGNVTGDNVGPLHLINVKRLAYSVRKPEEAFITPPLSTERQPSLSVSADRESVAAAVDRYLAGRGLAQKPAAPVTKATVANIAQDVVDRFLSRRQEPAAPAAACCSCTAREPEQAPAAAPPVAPEPEVVIADFVCENDVRDALAAKRKIFIGPRTIVTPSARELGERSDVLVLAKR